MHCQGRVVLPYQINVTLEASILTKNICVGKVQTLVLTVYDFAPLSNFSYYTWNHTLVPTSTWWCRRLPVHHSMYLPLDWLDVFLGLSSWLGEYTWTKFKQCLCFNYKGLHWSFTLHLLFPLRYTSVDWFRYFMCLNGSPRCKHATLFKIRIPELDANKMLSKKFSSVVIYQ